MHRLFAATVPGLEPVLSKELTGLGLTPRPLAPINISGEPKEDSGGVEFEASLRDLYRANLHLRTASRILLRFGEFKTVGFIDLRKKAAALPWELFLKPGQPVSLRVTCHKSRLYHSDAVAERVISAIADRLKKPLTQEKFDESTNNLPQLVVIRLVNDVCSVSIDTSGALLHRRGYRLETAKAPLRETLAAGLILASGWDAVSPLIDPFCGSGTIPIEAALISRHIAPGKNRSFAFMSWPNYDSALWKKLINEAATAEIAVSAPIFASDRDEGAIRITQANASRAGVLENIQASHRAFSALEPLPAPGWIITNPPYGVRVSPSKDLRDLYSQFGNILHSQFPSWNIGLLSSTEFYAGHTRLRFDNVIPLINGGIRVKFFIGQVPKISPERR
jgi:putative N6-adenine-specific DNA methylase